MASTLQLLPIPVHVVARLSNWITKHIEYGLLFRSRYLWMPSSVIKLAFWQYFQNERFLRSYLNFGVLPWKMNYSFASEGQVELYVWFKQIPFCLPYFFLWLIEFLFEIDQLGAKGEVKVHHHDRILSLLASAVKQMSQSPFIIWG